jgi:hypothetical protein
MKYRIEINKYAPGYEYTVYRKTGDFEEKVLTQDWYSMFKWACIMKAKRAAKDLEYINPYPIKVADIDYEV